jgi:hypothetical protein
MENRPWRHKHLLKIDTWTNSSLSSFKSEGKEITPNNSPFIPGLFWLHQSGLIHNDYIRILCAELLQDLEGYMIVSEKKKPKNLAQV